VAFPQVAGTPTNRNNAAGSTSTGDSPIYIPDGESPVAFIRGNDGSGASLGNLLGFTRVSNTSGVGGGAGPI
jgi:hypothetical protein